MTTQVRNEDEVLGIITRHLEDALDQKPEGPLTAETRLIDDLALDSLQSFEMVAALEDHYHITLSIDLLQDVQTLGDVARVVAGVPSEAAN